MTRRRKIAVAGIVVALALAAAAGVAVALRPASLEQKFKQVRKRMTFDQVVEIMGAPDRTIRHPSATVWRDRRALAYVYFDESDKVTEMYFVSAEDLVFLDRVLAWLGL